MTESAKTGLICTKYTYSFFCVDYTISASFIEFLRKFCIYDKIFDKVYTMLGKRVINLKGSKLGQILRADKIGLRRLSHIFALLDQLRLVESWCLLFVVDYFFNQWLCCKKEVCIKNALDFTHDID